MSNDLPALNGDNAFSQHEFWQHGRFRQSKNSGDSGQTWIPDICWQQHALSSEMNLETIGFLSKGR
jgi:hypothetical protein